jgi:hypothetical protein
MQYVLPPNEASAASQTGQSISQKAGRSGPTSSRKWSRIVSGPSKLAECQPLRSLGERVRLLASPGGGRGEDFAGEHQGQIFLQVPSGCCTQTITPKPLSRSRCAAATAQSIAIFTSYANHPTKASSRSTSQRYSASSSSSTISPASPT